MELIGKRVEWELSGRGRGSVASGRVVMSIPSGTTNADALNLLKQKMPGLRIRPKYCRFHPDTFKTERVFVLVEQESKRSTTLYWIYAPNVLEVKEV